MRFFKMENVSPWRSLRLGIRGVFKCREGVSSIEAAIVLPFLVFLYFGVVDLSYLVTGKGRLATVTDTVGDLVSQSRDNISQGEISGMYEAAKTILEGYSTTSLVVVVTDYYVDAGVVKVRWTHSSGGACTDPVALNNTVLMEMMVEGNDLIVVNSCLSISLITNQVIGAGPIPVSFRVLKRPRYSSSIDCQSC